jgi:FtsH-binding integral membrane protein
MGGAYSPLGIKRENQEKFPQKSEDADMSYADSNPYATTAYGGGVPVAVAEEWERTTFIRRTYFHLAVAILAFIGIEMVIFQSFSAQQLTQMTAWMISGWHWLLVLGGFMVVSMIADNWARSGASLGLQYAGLGLYVLAEAIIMVPLLWLAQLKGGGGDVNLIGMAGFVTAVVFGGLTAVVFLTRADFSWLGRYLALASLVAVGLIVGGILFGFNLGQFFTVAMIALAAGYILYFTSNIMHHYRQDQYVAASLALFASVALLFWYILSFLMSRE